MDRKIIDAEKEQYEKIQMYIIRHGQCAQCGTEVITNLNKHSIFEQRCRTNIIFCPICTSIIHMRRIKNVKIYTTI